MIGTVLGMLSMEDTTDYENRLFSCLMDEILDLHSVKINMSKAFCRCLVLLILGSIVLGIACSRRIKREIDGDTEPAGMEVEQATLSEQVSSVDGQTARSRTQNAAIEEGKPILLRYHFKMGQELRWNVLQSQKIITSIQGMTKTIETTSWSTKLWKVVKLDEDGSATFEYSVDDVRMKQSQTDDEDAQYDSRQDPEIPLKFSNLEGMIGVPLAHLTINMRGETNKKVALRSYGAAGEENRITIPLPEQPIAVGEYWDVDIPIELPQSDGKLKKIRSRQRFTLESFKTGLARISFVSQVLTPLDPSEQAKIIDRYSSGRVVLDLDAGQLVSQETIVDKRVVGFQGLSDSLHHKSRFMECCCGLKSCDICSKNNE